MRKFKDDNPEMKCASCGHKRKDHNIRHKRAIAEVKDCKFCKCEKFYPEHLTFV